MLPNHQLIDAVRKGYTAEFNEAVERGADINATDFNGRTALEVAIRGDNPEIARKLIQLGANPNQAIGKRGDKLIHLAVRLGSIGMLAVLLEEGADPTAKGNQNRTPLYYAERAGLQFMSRILIEEGAISPSLTMA